MIKVENYYRVMNCRLLLMFVFIHCTCNICLTQSADFGTLIVEQDFIYNKKNLLLPLLLQSRKENLHHEVPNSSFVYCHPGEVNFIYYESDRDDTIRISFLDFRGSTTD